MDQPDQPDQDQPNQAHRGEQPAAEQAAPHANRGLLFLAGVILLIPILALLWVGSYARSAPKLGGFPFFIWYQFMWVFLTAGLTAMAYLIVERARPSGIARRSTAGGTR